MNITIEELNGNSLSRAEKLMAGFPAKAEKAARFAARRAASHVRKQSNKEIQERYAISSDKLSKYGKTKINVSYVMGQGIVANIVYMGVKIPLHAFHHSSPKDPVYDTGRYVRAMVEGSWKMVHPGVAAKGHILKSTGPFEFENAFVQRMRSGHVGIFERTGGIASTGNTEIEQIMGLSSAQMVGSEEVRERLAEEAEKKFDERLDYEISRIINGWGRR